ncbi:MAG: DUF4340 domain-containing protein [Bacillota bacterium]|nr:DUF4340 domain-containing protein [Bacillota bacterium]
MKRNRNLIVLSAILLLLIGVLVIWRVTGAGEDAGSTPTSIGETTKNPLALARVTADNLKQIVVQNTSGRYVFEPVTVTSGTGTTTTHYVLTEPAGIDQDQDRVSTLARALLNVTASRVAVEEAEDLAAYGLADPGSSVRYVLKEGAAIELQLGNPLAADESQVYVKTPDSDTVYSVTGLENKISFDATDFISLALKPFELLEITELRIQRTSDPAVLAAHVETPEERGVTPTPTPAPAADGSTAETMDPQQAAAMQTWRIDKPVSWVGNSDDLNKLVSELASLTAKEVVALEIDDPAAYGLDEPEFAFSIGQANNLVTISFGRQSGDKERYVSLSDRPGLYTVSTTAVTMLERPWLKFFESFSLIQNISDIGEATFESPEGRHVFEIYHPSPDEKKADDTLVESYTMDGRDATVVDSSKKSYFRLLYQGLIGIFVNGSDYEAEPQLEPEFTITMTERRENPETWSIELVPRDETTLYIFRDGVYSGFYTLRQNLDNETRNVDKLGILQRIERLETAMEKQTDGVYDFPADDESQ